MYVYKSMYICMKAKIHEYVCMYACMHACRKAGSSMYVLKQSSIIVVEFLYLKFQISRNPDFLEIWISGIS